MSHPRYIWRQLMPLQRAEILESRKKRGVPWHSPPHRPNFSPLCFHVTAACYEHQPHIGRSDDRMDAFTHDLLAVLASHANQTFAWTVLQNHYHALVKASDILGLLRELGKLHGRSSYDWNTHENTRGRKVFFRAIERSMRSERHYFATLNYVHHNPVHHGYVEKWAQWPWSSASQYLSQTDPNEAKRIWKNYPLDGYGKGWDDSGI